MNYRSYLKDGPMDGKTLDENTEPRVVRTFRRGKGDSIAIYHQVRAEGTHTHTIGSGEHSDLVRVWYEFKGYGERTVPAEPDGDRTVWDKLRGWIAMARACIPADPAGKTALYLEDVDHLERLLAEADSTIRDGLRDQALAEGIDEFFDAMASPFDSSADDVLDRVRLGQKANLLKILQRKLAGTDYHEQKTESPEAEASGEGAQAEGAAGAEDITIGPAPV